MTLNAGTKLGPYEILSLIGEGGMGQVYKARDARLNRTVAVKILPQHISEKPEAKARFEREAQTLASLSHPHICPVFDVGQQGGTDYLVMEYIEGQTLAQQLEKDALALDEGLKVAIEIADALDKAHRQGVVHRDLKPGNIMLTKSGAKLLDFGLAKLKQDAGPVSGMSALPTNPSMTAEGTILGTLQYMAPEQLEGQEADARTDIFAFGAMLYEMVTGKKAFEGKSQASLIGAILKDTPKPISTLQPVAPPTLDRFIARCLAKDPNDRWQTARDLALELMWIIEGDSRAEIAAYAPSSRKRERFAWALVAVAMLTIAAMSVPVWRYFSASPEAQPIQFLVSTPSVGNSNNNPLQVSISPDGRWIAFLGFASRTTNGSLFVRQIDSVAVRPLPGTEGGTDPFWSGDSRYIGFSGGGKLKKIAVSGGVSEIISDLPSAGGGAWNEANTILFTSGNVLYRVQATGGQAVAVTKLDDSQKEVAHLWPSFLPDGRRFLYWVSSPEPSIYLGSLDSVERTRLLSSETRGVYANPGYVLFQRQGILFAQPFDVRKGSLTEEPIRIAEGAGASGQRTGRAGFAASRNGTLIHRATPGAGLRRFMWFDRTGKQLGALGDVGSYLSSFDLSPDGKQVAVAKADPATNKNDLWLMDLTRGGLITRFTFDPTAQGDVIWSPDGTRIAFSIRKGTSDIFEKKASGIGEEVPLVESPENDNVEDWSKDGRYIAYINAGGTAIRILPLFGDRKPFVFLQSPYNKDEPHFSFDGKWLAYDSAESGTWQIYVASFPTADQKRLISTNGGVAPRWRRDGKELYYLAPDGKLMAVDINPGEKIDSGVPRVLFDTGLPAPNPTFDNYAVTPDGQRFLVQLPVETETPPITVVVNWTASLKNNATRGLTPCCIERLQSTGLGIKVVVCPLLPTGPLQIESSSGISAGKPMNGSSKT